MTEDGDAGECELEVVEAGARSPTIICNLSCNTIADLGFVPNEL